MRKATFLLLIIFILSIAPVKETKAAQLNYFSFDYQWWYDQSPNDSWVQSWNDSYSLQKVYLFQSGNGVYWAFVYIEVQHTSTDGQNTYCERRVMVKIYADDVYITHRTIDAVFHDGVMKFYIPIRLDNPTKDFKVEVWSSTGSGATIQYTVKRIAVLAVGDKGYSIDTRSINPELQAGAAGTPYSLSLNKTEADLGQSIDLGTGSLRFWLKWDGTKPLTILSTVTTTTDGTPVTVPALGIDENGTLYTYANGVKYSLNSTVPIGEWVVVAFAWKPGYAYIMLSKTANADNATIVEFNWNGNFMFDAIGEYNQTTMSAIDEFVVWDDFIDKDSILAAGSKALLKLNLYNKEIPVLPDGGSYLPTPLTISFYGLNNTLISYSTWYGTEQTLTVPNNTEKIIIGSNGASSTYQVSEITMDGITFPAKDATLVAEKVNIVPATPGVLKVKDIKGHLLYAQKIMSSATVIAVSGETYYISFTDENGVTRAAGWFVLTGSGTTLVLSSNVMETKGVYADAWWDEKTHALKVEYVDDTRADQNITIVIEFYYKNTLIGRFPVTEHTSKYIGTFYPPDVADFALVDIQSSTGYHKEISVVVNGGGEYSFLPVDVFPPSLFMGLFAITGLLIAPARYRYLSPLIATAILTFAKLISLFDTPSWLISAFLGLTILSFIIYRPSSRSGVM